MRKFLWTLPLTVAACLMGAPAHADGFNEVVVVTHVEVLSDDGEGLWDLSEAPLRVAVHRADQPVGASRGQGFDADFLCHVSQTAQPQKS